MAKESKKSEEKELKQSKIGDIITLIAAGTNVMFVHDRDMRYFIPSLLTETAMNDKISLDDFETFVLFQGFQLIHIKWERTKERLNFASVMYKDPYSGLIGPVRDVAVAVNLFLDKMESPLVRSNKALLILALEPIVIDNSLGLAGTIREHYNDLVNLMQIKSIERKSSGVGAAVIATDADKKPVVQQEDIEEYTPAKIAKQRARSILILSPTSRLPERITGYCANMGTVSHNIPCKAEAIAETLYNGLTSTEQDIVDKLGVLVPKADVNQTTDMVKRYRKAVFSSSSVVRDLEPIHNLNAFGGYPKLIEFIEQRKRLLQKQEAILEKNIILKGIFLAGLPGSGKSILLECLGEYWRLPSYRLQLDAIFGKFVGESEGNLLSALETLEKLAPCYVMIDEIDKALAGVGENEVAGSDVPRRVFGILLEHLARPNNIIYGVSANRVRSIPEEFHRRGRFDRIFFMGLPNKEAIAHILAIHLKKRGYDADDLVKANKKIMAEALERMIGFTGAEIENVVNEAVIRSIDEDKPLAPETLLLEANATTTMDREKGDIKELEAWSLKFATQAQ